MKSLRNWLPFLFVVLSWGTNWIVMKTSLKYAGPLNFVLDRLVFAVLCFVPLLVPLRKRIPRDKETMRGLLFLGVLNALSMIFVNVGLVDEKSGISAVLTYTQPLFVFCLAVPFLGEKADLSRVLGVLTGFFGVVVLATRRLGSFEGFSYSGFLLILGAVFWAFAIIYYKKSLSKVDATVTTVFQLGWSAISVLPLASVLEGLSFPMVQGYILLLLYVSVVGSGFGQIVWIFLLSKEDATVVASSSLMIPMVALALGWLFLGESFESSSLVGIILTMVGVYLVNRNNSKSKVASHSR